MTRPSTIYIRPAQVRLRWPPTARPPQFGPRRSHGSAGVARPNGTPSARPMRAVNARSKRRLRGSVESARTNGVPRAKPNRVVDLSPSAPDVDGPVTTRTIAMLESTKVVGRLGRRAPRLELVIGVVALDITRRTAMRAGTRRDTSLTSLRGKHRDHLEEVAVVGVG